MSDQAEQLRRLIDQRPAHEVMPCVVAVSSGKGGVGKSNFTLNFALELIRAGSRVVIIDADIGFANIEVLLGIRPKRSLHDLITQRLSIWDVMETGPNGLRFLAGGSDFTELVHLNNDQMDFLVEQFTQLHGKFDVVLIDMGAGLTAQTLRLIMACDEMIVVSTPEPTAIADAYSLIKMVCTQANYPPLQLVINRVENLVEGREASEKISLVAKRFLQVDIRSLGFIFDDPNVSKSVKGQAPFTLAYPNSSATRCVRQIVANYHRQQQLDRPVNGLVSFIHRLGKWFQGNP